MLDQLCDWALIRVLIINAIRLFIHKGEEISPVYSILYVAVSRREQPQKPNRLQGRPLYCFIAVAITAYWIDILSEDPGNYGNSCC